MSSTSTTLKCLQPISFDELISKGIASGIDEKGWRIKLKRFLDLQVNLIPTPENSSNPPRDSFNLANTQGVTYFTEDPTGNRRRR
jgi:hypothetical protein